MALEYVDTFSDYTAAQITRYFSAEVTGNSIGSGSALQQVSLDGNYALSSGNGRNGNSSLRITSDYRGMMWGGSAQATRAVGFAWKAIPFLTSAGYTTGFPIVAFCEANIIQVALAINYDGTLSVVNGIAATAGTVLATSSRALKVGNYYFIEFAATINNSTGSYTVNVNGNQWLNGSGANTRKTTNNFCSGVVLGPFFGGNNFITWDYSDLYINNDGTLYGDCRVEGKLPTGNGATNNFTRGGTDSGANWSQVNDATANDNTNYVLSGSAGDIDLYTYPALSTTAGTVKGVMPVPVLENDTAGASNTQVVYRSGTTNYVGQTSYVAQNAYGATPDVKVTDPDTSSAWTISGVNSAQFGLKRVA